MFCSTAKRPEEERQCILEMIPVREKIMKKIPASHIYIRDEMR